MEILKHFIKRLVLPLLIVLIAGYITYAFTKPIPQLTASVNPPSSSMAQSVTLPWPSYGEAAVGAVGYGVLASNGPQSPLPTASTIKILTALAVLDQKPLKPGQQGPTITINQADVDSYNKYVAEDGSVVPVQLGEQISEYQALQALLLPSANNIAETLARWAFGSIDAYNTYANQLALNLGMTSTTVTDPSGFLPTTVSSPHDLTILGEAAMQNSVIPEIVDQPSATLPIAGVVYNVNQVLGQDGIIGIKTGNNDQDTGVFLFGATDDVSGHNITIVGTIMGAPDLTTALTDARPVIETADQDFSLDTVLSKGTVVGHYSIPWGNPVAAVAAKGLQFVAWRGSSVNTAVSLKSVKAPVSSSRSVGSATASSDSNGTQASIAVALQDPVARPSWIWRLTHVF